MILSIIVILLIGGITYWHYSQGFFSALFSAVSAVLAAVLAVSYHEPIVAALLRGKMSDYADAMMLVAIFALTYISLRTIFDNMVPCNARLPVYLDRIGGAAMGLVASCFAAGIFALAAQMMPFGPSVGGYVRYDTEDRDVSVQVTGGRGQNSDVPIENQLKEDRFEGGKKSLLVPVDDLVLATVQKLSDGGSLAGERSLASVHPDYADELFAQRLGVQIGAKHTAVNLPGAKAQVSLPEGPAVFEFTQDISKSQIDGEVPQVHQRPVTVKKPAPPDDFPLVVRLMFNHDASDQDGIVRLSPGSVRLVADGTNYWPVGTIERGTTLYTNKMDDHLIVNVKDNDRGADFLFFVDAHKVVDGDPKAKTDRKVKDGVFVEAKRLAKIDLGGQEIRPGVTKSKEVEVVRKAAVVDKDKKAPKQGTEGGPGEGAANPAAAAELDSLAHASPEQIKAFFKSADYTNRQRSDEQFIGDVYRGILQRDPDTRGFEDWVAAMKNGAVTRERVVEKFLKSPEYTGRHRAPAAVGAPAGEQAKLAKALKLKRK